MRAEAGDADGRYAKQDYRCVSADLRNNREGTRRGGWEGGGGEWV